MSTAPLPRGWTRATLGDLGGWSSGGTPSRSNKTLYNGTIPWVKTGELKDGLVAETEEHITRAALEASSAKVFPAGSLLIAMYGATIGKLGILGLNAASNQACAALLAEGMTCEVIPFVFHYLRSCREIFKAAGQGGAQPNISQGFLKTFSCPIPPLSEQRRIVAKLEALLSRSRRAKEALDAIPALLERFRQSVLAAAFRGDLTRDWREKNPDVEPASKLLERIRVERRRRWEAAEIEKMRARGRVPSGDGWRERYEEPEPVDDSELAKLPEKWCWATLEEITVNFDGDRIPVRLQDRASRSGKYPYYGASGVIDHVDHYLFDGHFLLIAEDGANLLSRSTPIAFEAAGKFWVNNHAHVVQTPAALVPLAYLAAYVNGLDISKLVTGTAQPKLTQKSMNRIPVPLAPRSEQDVISRITGHCLDVTLSLSGTAAEAQTRVGALNSAVLRSAFRGELVPQDPNDEPASVLLERIKAEREQQAKHAESTGRRKGRRRAKGA